VSSEIVTVPLFDGTRRWGLGAGVVGPTNVEPISPVVVDEPKRKQLIFRGHIDGAAMKPHRWVGGSLHRLVYRVAAPACCGAIKSIHP
jgi:hypothetical protein